MEPSGRAADAFSWLLVPGQALDKAASGGAAKVEWSQSRLGAGDGLAVRASKKLIADDGRFMQMGPSNLRNELDRVPLWRGNHVALRQLWEDFPRYLYLPRLKDSEVLTNSIRDGAGRMMWETESFAIAERWDEVHARYVGLVAGDVGRLVLDGSTLVVKPEVARRQMDADAAVRAAQPPPGGGTAPSTATATPTAGTGATTGADPSSPRVPPKPKRRFHGSVELSPLKVASDADRIAVEVIKHLTSLVGAEVRVRLEIDAVAPDGVPEDVVRVVTLNANVLKFTSGDFEDD